MKLEILGCSYNTYYRIYRGRYVISPKGREFRETIKNLVEPNVLIGDIKISIIFNFKKKIKRDCDNYLKSLIDALKGIYYEDDSQITELYVKKIIGIEDSIEIECEKITHT